MLDVSVFHYIGPWDPSDADGPDDPQYGDCDPVVGCEYPDTTGHEVGAFWFTVLSNPENPSDPVEEQQYTFQTGELQGKVIKFGDFMVRGTAGWSIMASSMNPLLYMKRSKEDPFLDNGDPLIVNGQIQNVYDGVADSDVVTVSQLRTKVDKTGSIMTGSLVIDTTGETYVTRVEDSTASSEMFKDKILLTDKTTGTEIGLVNDQASNRLRLKINNITSMYIEENMPPSTQFSPSESNHLVRKEYVDDLVGSPIGTPAEDGQFLTGQTDGTFDWITYVYSNSTPVPEQVGGIEPGETFDNVSLLTMFDRLLYPYQYPAFSAFAIDAQATAVEVGTVVGGAKTFTWTTTNPGNVQGSVVSIKDETGTYLLTDTADDGSEDYTITDVSYNTPDTFTWTIEGTNTKGQLFKKDFSVNWRYRSFWGSGADNLDDTGIIGLQKSELRTSRARVYDTPSSSSAEFKYVAYPQEQGQATSIVDNDTGFPVSMHPDWNPKTMDITSNGVTASYYVYKTQNPTSAALNIKID